jgi:hypothetical protein
MLARYWEYILLNNFPYSVCSLVNAFFPICMSRGRWQQLLAGKCSRRQGAVLPSYGLEICQRRHILTLYLQLEDNYFGGPSLYVHASDVFWVMLLPLYRFCTGIKGGDKISINLWLSYLDRIVGYYLSYGASYAFDSGIKSYKQCAGCINGFGFISYYIFRISFILVVHLQEVNKFWSRESYFIVNTLLLLRAYVMLCVGI